MEAKEPQSQEEQRAEKLSALKEKYGTVFEVKVPVDANEQEFAYGYCKKIERVVMLMLIGKLKDNFVEGLELLWKNSVIPEATDPRIMEDDDLYISAVLKMEEILTFKKAEVKKI